MKLTKYGGAATEVLLIFPAVLFMTALFVRNLQPQQFEPAHTAQQIVNWYAARPGVGLWILLIGLPLTVLLTGAATLLRRWMRDPQLRQAARTTLAEVGTHVSTLLIALSTVAAGTVLTIVALHMITD